MTLRHTKLFGGRVRAIVVLAILVMAFSGFSFASPAYAGGGGGNPSVLVELPRNGELWGNCWANNYSPSSASKVKNWFDLKIVRVDRGRGPSGTFECRHVNPRSDVPYIFSYGTNGWQYGYLSGGALTVVCEDSRQRLVLIRRDSGSDYIHLGCAG